MQSHKEKLATNFFETWNSPAIRLLCSAETSLAAASGGALSTGMVLESGGGYTSAVPIVDGVVQYDAIQTIPWGGADLTDRIESRLIAKGLAVSSSVQKAVSRGVKEKLCSVPWGDTASAAVKSISYVVPVEQGPTIELSSDILHCPEALFSVQVPPLSWPVLRTLLLGRRSRECAFSRLPNDIFLLIVRRVNRCGWSDLLKASLATFSDSSVRARLLSNVVLAGGNTLFHGAAERLAKELPGSTIVALPNRLHLAWIGARVIQKERPEWISKESYDEHGPSMCWAHPTPY